MSDKIDLDELSKLDAKTTMLDTRGTHLVELRTGLPISEGSTAAVVELRNAVPALLAEIARLKRELEAK